jgi:stage IV sporulation protein FB
VTFALAGLLWLADQALESRTLSREAPGLLDRLVLSGWGQMVGILATMNLTLGIFNLIPAFPLDGGRIFRAVLAMRLEHVRATTIAARVGQGAAVLLGVSGLIDNSGVQYFGAGIRVFIAFFIWTSAQAELNALKRRRDRSGQTAGDLMIRNAAVLGPHVSLASAQTFMADSQQSIYPVLDGVGRPVGWVTRAMVETALTRLIGGTAIREMMLAQVEYVGEDTPVQEAIELMVEKQHPALAVVENDGRLRGILVINPTPTAGAAGGSGLN